MDSGRIFMPSEDKFHQERPEVNSWLSQDESGKLSEIAKAEPRSAGTKTGKRAPMAAHVQALAARLGIAPEKFAERIPADTLRRLKYSMLEQVQPDGTRKYEHDVGIIRDGVRPLLATDRSYDPIVRNALPGRDEHGKFTK